MLHRLHQLFRYDDWANREVLASLQGVGNPPLRSLRWMAHILATEHLWFSRIQSQKPSLPVWPSLTIEECERLASEQPKIWAEYLDGLAEGDLNLQVTYVNSRGESWVNSVEDILMHVIMHSVYHRGQIASDMRLAGHVPAYTDFIHGVRQNLIE